MLNCIIYLLFLDKDAIFKKKKPSEEKESSEQEIVIENPEKKTEIVEDIEVENIEGKEKENG